MQAKKWGTNISTPEGERLSRKYRKYFQECVISYIALIVPIIGCWLINGLERLSICSVKLVNIHG